MRLQDAHDVEASLGGRRRIDESGGNEEGVDGEQKVSSQVDPAHTRMSDATMGHVGTARI